MAHHVGGHVHLLLRHRDTVANEWLQSSESQRVKQHPYSTGLLLKFFLDVRDYFFPLLRIGGIHVEENRLAAGLTNFTEDFAIGDFDLSSDASELVFDREKTNSDLLMIER